jgi:hypothetical protein
VGTEELLDVLLAPLRPCPVLRAAFQRAVLLEAAVLPITAAAMPRGSRREEALLLLPPFGRV